MKIVISGYYGFDNTGDEAVLNAIVEQLRHFNPRIKITVLSADPKKTSLQFGVNSVHRYSILTVIKELISSDVLISGGGSLFQDVTGRFSIFYYLGIIWLAKLLGKKFVILGQGYGPVKRPLGKWLVRAILNSAALITLRDEQSFKELSALGVTAPPAMLAADPAFLLSSAPDISRIISQEALKIEDRPVVGVCIRPPVNKSSPFLRDINPASVFRGWVKGLDKSPDFEPKMALALDAIIEKYNAGVLFIPFKFPDDVEESAKIAILMKNKTNIITRQYDPKEILSLIGSLDILIGMRLHSLIFALISRVPVIGLDYDPKVGSLLGEFDAPAVKTGASAKDIADAFDLAWEGRHSAAAAFKEKTALKKQKAAINFDAFFEYTDHAKEFYLFGAKINNITMNSALSFVDEYVRSRGSRLIFTPNPEIIMAARKDEELRGIINSADLNIPDGVGIVLAAKLLGRHIAQRLTGIDLMTAILDLARQKKYRVFLLGSAPGVANAAAKNLSGVDIAGVHHGYFSDGDEKEVIDKIKKAKPDILFVGLGAPRQEKWLYKHYKELNVPVSMVVGGSMDVLSGRVKRSPKALQALGIEWLYRLVKDPKRWKRQLSLIKFVGLAMNHKIRKYTD